MDQNTAEQNAAEAQANRRLASTNEVYQQRVDNLEGADDLKRDELEESRKGVESVDSDLADEAKFVGNPDDLRKDVPSEEKFSEGLTDGDADSGLPDTEPAAKKTAAKKTAAKKG